MQHPAEFNGYLHATARPNDAIIRTKVRIELAPQIDVNEAKLKRYTLAFTARAEDDEAKPNPEIAIHLRPEEVLDLCDWIKNEFERIERIRNDLGRDRLP
jgi:hypothetical protein